MEREDVLKIFGNVISKNRRKVNISQKELADHLGVTKSSVSRYESGKMEIPASSLPAISEYCQFPLRDYIVKLEAHREVEKIITRYEIDDVAQNSMVREQLAEYLAEPKQQDALEALTQLSYLEQTNKLIQVQKEAADIVTLAVVETVTESIKNEAFKLRMQAYCDRILQKIESKK